MQPGKKGAVPRHIGRTKGGLNSKLHAVVDSKGRPILMLLTEGQVSDHIGAKLLYPDLPEDSTLIGDKGYDSNEFREALAAKQITVCIPPRANRTEPIEYSKTLYKLRHKIEPEPSRPRYIETVHGVGYRFAERDGG